jgi:lipase chaperone LimK
MKSQALQELVKKIFSDEKTKQQFMSNPESILSQLSLTEEEKKAVLNAHAKMGLVASDSGQLEAVINPTGFWS